MAEWLLFPADASVTLVMTAFGTFFFLDWWMFLFVWMIERASGWLFREWRKPNDVKPDDFTFFVLFFLSFLLYRRFISFLIFDIHTPTILVLLHVQFAHHPPRYSWSTSSSYASWSHRISSQASARKWSIRSLSFRYIYISIYHYIDILWTHLRTTCSCGYIRSYPRLVFSFFLYFFPFYPSSSSSSFHPSQLYQTISITDRERRGCSGFFSSLSLSISKRLSPQSASPHARIRGSACYSFFFPESNRRHRCGFLFPISPSFLSSWTLSLTISVFFFFHIMLFRRLPLYRAHWLIQFDWIMPFSLSWLSVTILPQWTSIATGTLWQWRSPRARFPQDGPTSDLRKVSGLTSLYTETDQQYLSQVGSPGCLL